MPTATRFAGYPSAVVYGQPNGEKPVQHLIWGDWLRLKSRRNGPFCEVRARGVDGWMRQEDIQEERVLEVVFVDVGQGDGCLLVTPKDKHILIDAGTGDNMYRFLRWRYGGFSSPWEFEAAVISHPDADHYSGFDPIFDEPNVTIRTVCHNGIMERTGKNSLGPRTTSGSPRYLTDLIQSTDDLRNFLSVPSRWGRKKYPTMIEKGLRNGKFRNFQMLSVENGYMPGYGSNADLSIQVLAPVMERSAQNRPTLRWFGRVGMTKNGHSVVLRVQYRNVSLLLGGDLNIPSENFLLNYHTGLSAPPTSVEEERLLLEAARKTFEVDIAKSCHHGSADFSSTYLAATNPIATVISSGDNEPHSHPRADALGTIGLCSRGSRPLIFSTELARSAKELIKHPQVLRTQLKALQAEIDKTPTATAKDRRKKQSLTDKFNKLVVKIERSIAVFGAINVRTDGKKAVVAQKIERPQRKDRKWDIYRLEPHGGVLQYMSEH
jgi:beta-lactamase superfamily II metal-dependent hydrolase